MVGVLRERGREESDDDGHLGRLCWGLARYAIGGNVNRHTLLLEPFLSLRSSAPGSASSSFAC